MKTILTFLLLTILIKAGHIYVSDPTMFYVNKNFINSVSIMFKLESGLIPNEIIKISWPFQFTFPPNATVL